MIDKSKVYKGSVCDLTFDGKGIVKIDSYPVFVENAVLGDEIIFEVTKTNKTYGFGKIKEISLPSPDRCVPKCKDFESCGGCDLSHIRYEKQLEIKKERVLSCLVRLGKLEKDSFEIYDTLGMDEPSEYRNKMVFPIGVNKMKKVVGGFYRRASHEIVELKSCSQGPEIASRYLGAVLEYMRKNNISAYDEKTHKGLIRRVFVRLGKTTKEAMVVISANGNNLPEAEKLIDALLSLHDNSYSLKSVILNINKQKNNLVLGEKNVTLYGEGFIFDTLCGVKFKISPNSFFQVNPYQTEKLYQKAIEFAELSGKETVIDLYCGIGTISLLAAKSAGKVIGVEIVDQAIKDAIENAKENKISNAEFITGSAETISVELSDSGIKADVIFIDPPRKGSDEVTLDCICKMSPEKIVYISCNPATLARDLAYLEMKGYKTIKVQPVDMFPNTNHVETVVLLSQLKPDDVIEVDIDHDELDITSFESKATYEEIKAYVLNNYGFKVSSLYIAQIKTKYGIKDDVNYNISKKCLRVPAYPPEKEKAITEALRHFKMID